MGLEGRGVRSVYLSKSDQRKINSKEQYIRNGGVTFHAVEQNIETCANLYGSWARFSVVGIL